LSQARENNYYNKKCDKVQISARGGVRALTFRARKRFTDHRKWALLLPRLKSMMRCALAKQSVLLITVQGGPTSVKLHFGSLLSGAKPKK
jgi:hypothetical protein